MAAVPKNSHLTVYRIFPPVESPVKAKKNAACWAGSVFLLAIKENPRLCRGDTKAYGVEESKKEKVSKLE